MCKALPRWVVCVFFAAFLALGLVTAGDYGPAWDEQTEMDILRMNLWEYARHRWGWTKVALRRWPPSTIR